MSDPPDLVDDEKSILDVLAMGFKRAGIPVQTALTAEDAIVLLEVKKFGAVVTDKNLPGKSGLKNKRFNPQIGSEGSEAEVEHGVGERGRREVGRAEGSRFRVPTGLGDGGRA